MKPDKKCRCSVTVMALILLISLSLNSQGISKVKNHQPLAVKYDKNWVQIYRRNVRFPNGIGVQLLIANSEFPHSFIASISPDEKIFVLKHIFSPGHKDNDKENDMWLCDSRGNITGSVQPLSAPDAISDFWSHNNTFASSTAHYIINMRKFKKIPMDNIKIYREWSMEGDLLVHSDDSFFKEAYISSIQNDHFITHSASAAEVTNLLGEAYLPALRVNHEVTGIFSSPSGIEQGYQSNLVGRNIYPSPDGKHVLLQNYLHKKVSWRESSSPDDDWFYYIVDKHGFHLQAKYTGMSEPVYIQWLDNRWLLGRTVNPEWENHEGYGKLSAKGVKLVLWDTDTGKHFYAPLPVQYEYDAMRCKLLQANTSAKK